MFEPGICYYNGFWFPGAAISSVKCSPVMDSTGRARKYLKFEITIESMIYPGCDMRPSGARVPPLPAPQVDYTPFFPDGVKHIDGSSSIPGIPALRRVLSEPGGLLFFRDKGLGYEFVVSGEPGKATHLDLEFGPKPTVVSLETVDGHAAGRLVWTVTTCIGDCPAKPLSGLLALITEFSYGISWSIGENGCTTRKISGSIEAAIGQRRAGSLVSASGTQAPLNRITGSADQFRDRITFTVPLQMTRTQEYTLSPDRRTLSFSIVDTEVPTGYNPWPVYTVQPRVQVTVATASGSKTLANDRWQVTISGTINVAKGYSKGWAWLAFLNIIKQRRDFARNNAKLHLSASDSLADGNKGGKKTSAILTRHLSITDDLFQNSLSVSISWDVWCSLGSLFDATGLMRDTAIGTWEAYRSSMESSWNPRGWYKLKHNHQTDVIVSVCDSAQPQMLGEVLPGHETASPDPLLGSDMPSKEESWVLFEPRAELIQKNMAVTHYPMVGDTPAPFGAITLSSTANGIQSTPSSASASRSNSGAPIVQHLSQPYYHVRWSGRAVRLGYAIPKPELIEYGGRKAKIVGDFEFVHGSPTRVGGVSVYVAKWSAEYALDGIPSGDLVATKPNIKEFPQ